MTAFREEVSRLMVEANQPHALVFVHGYNVDFDEAVRRTAQMAYDLWYQGVPVLYSWPSEGKFVKYEIDGEVTLTSAERFREFLKLLLSGLGARTVDIIAHSMGNRVLVHALKELDVASLPPGTATLREVVLAAADVPTEFFKTVAPRLRERVRRLTVYTSRMDRALGLAKLKKGYGRIGYSAGELVLVEGVDTIDASNIKGDILRHSYIAKAGPVLVDLKRLIGKSEPPAERDLERRELDGMPYWVLPLST